MLLAYTILQAHPEAIPLNPIARWEWVFPVVESIHICGFTLLVGTIVILDLRLLGLRLLRQSISQVARDLAPWIWTGIVLQLTTGPYLFSGDPYEYVQIAAFRTKMMLLLLALDFPFHGDPDGDGAVARFRAARMAQAGGCRFAGAMGERDARRDVDWKPCSGRTRG